MCDSRGRMVNRGNTKLIYKQSLLLIRTYSPVHTRRNTKERIKLETISEGETRMNSLSSLKKSTVGEGKQRLL